MFLPERTMHYYITGGGEEMARKRKGSFLGLGPAEYLAWMEVKPYTGKIMFRRGERCG